MTAKEYLGQAYRIDQRINCKLEQVASLRSLSTKATYTISDMPGSPLRDPHRMEGIIAKMIDMENDINNEIDILIDLKAEIQEVISGVDNIELRTLLELRYLGFMTWEGIAIAIGYNERHIRRMHPVALNKIEVPAICP